MDDTLKIPEGVPPHLERIHSIFSSIKKEDEIEKYVEFLHQNEITARVLGHETLQEMMMKKDEGLLYDQICQYPPISNLLTSWSYRLEDPEFRRKALFEPKKYTKITDLTHQRRAEIIAAVHVFIHTQWPDVAPESISEWQAKEADPKKNICSIYWRALQQVW